MDPPVAASPRVAAGGPGFFRPLGGSRAVVGVTGPAVGGAGAEGFILGVISGPSLGLPS
jgi:hypothetical protein